jgi:hypothetical protein
MKTRFITTGINIINGDTPLNMPIGNTSGTVSDIVANESGGDYRALNLRGGGAGAVGKYQFRWNIWKDKIAATTGIKNREDFRNNPKAQEAFFNNYYIPNEVEPGISRIRKSTNTKLDNDKLFKLYHFRGEQGAIDYLNGKTGDKPESYNMSISRYTGIPKMNLGGGLSTYQSLISPVASMIEGDGTSIGRSSLAGGLKLGIPGAILGGLQANHNLQEKLKQEKLVRADYANNLETQSNASYSQLALNPIGYYAKGGPVTPLYEAEKGEVIVGKADIEGKELSPNMTKVEGNSHEQGGTIGQGGNFIFSNDLKLSPEDYNILQSLNIRSNKELSYSESATKVAKLANNYSKPTVNYRASNTNKAMLNRISAVIQRLAISQENKK